MVSNFLSEITDTCLCFSSLLQSDLDYYLNFDEQERGSPNKGIENLMTQQSDTLISRLIHRLTIVLVQYLPSFWRLATAIFNGKFGKVCEDILPVGF